MLNRLIVLMLLMKMAACFKILAFLPFPMTSHQNVFAPILYELARRGHQVVYLTPVPPKLTHPNLHLRIMENFRDEFLNAVNLTLFGNSIKPEAARRMSYAAEKFAHKFYGNPEARKIIYSTDSYDAVIMESHFAQEPVSTLIHKFGCVAIELAPMGDVAWLNEMSGLPDNPAYQIDFKSDATDTMTFLERLHNFYVSWSPVLMNYYNLWRMQFVADQYFRYDGWETRPPLRKLISNKSMILINQDPVLSYPYPKAPHAKNIGGINLLPNNPLPKEIQKVMDEAPYGVIYFSMGSNLKTSEISSGEIGKAFMEAFRKLPQTILMKWEKDESPNFPPNVKTFKWFPQQDVLAHKKCLLFITHGGYLSLTESVYHGVPLVGIPFFADQRKNLRQIEGAGIGLRITYENITTESVTWAVKEILNNPRYKKEAVRRSNMMKERRHTALEEAAYWVEYAIKYPNALTPRSAFMSFFEVHMIDIYAFIICCTLIILKLFSSFIRLVRASNRKPVYSKKKKQ